MLLEQRLDDTFVRRRISPGRQPRSEPTQTDRDFHLASLNRSWDWSSQTFKLLPTVNSNRFSGTNAIPFGICPASITHRDRASATDHKRAVWSSLPAISHRPSGVNFKFPIFAPAYGPNSWRSPVAVLMRTIPSTRENAATRIPSGEMAMGVGVLASRNSCASLNAGFPGLAVVRQRTGNPFRIEIVNLHRAVPKPGRQALARA